MADGKHKQSLPKRSSDFDHDINFGSLGIFMLVIAAITIGSFVGMWFFGDFMKSRLDAQDDPGSPLLATGQTTTPPEPHLQVKSYADWAEMHADHERVLSSYEWANREAGRVRIPIEDSMAEIAAHGLPKFEIVGDGSLDATQTP